MHVCFIAKFIKDLATLLFDVLAGQELLAPNVFLHEAEDNLHEAFVEE